MTTPALPCALVAQAAGGATTLTPEGELRALGPAEARALAAGPEPLLVCHAPATAARLGVKALPPSTLDVLELYAFARPTDPCVPAPLGLARALNLPEPQGAEDGPPALLDAAQALLAQLDEGALPVAAAMGEAWPWTAHIFAALGAVYDPAVPGDPRALAVWDGMAEWEDAPPPDPPGHHGVSADEAQAALAAALGEGAEDRPGQRAYAAAVADVALAPPGADGAPHLLLAEGGTGTGKTLGYLAPAAAWAARNRAAVWVSTYTKALQRQIASRALPALFPDAAARHAATAVRKGRENTLCLLSLEEATKSPRHRVAAGLMARWAAATPDGDLTGAGFPGWLPDLVGWAATRGLADRRGECIYAACPHFRRCFVERSARRAEGAQIVVANHALVMARAAGARPGEVLPARYVFDEGHHLFDAADSAFAARLTAREMADLRRWLLGADTGGIGGRRSRMRGLARRAEGLVEGDEKAAEALAAVLKAARALPDGRWAERLADGAPRGPAEAFCSLAAAQVKGRTTEPPGPYVRECAVAPPVDGLAEAAAKLRGALEALARPMNTLAGHLRAVLGSSEGAELDADTRGRMDALARALAWRAEHYLAPWREMLEAVAGVQAANAPQDAQQKVLWLEVEPGGGGRLADVGLVRHWVDPMAPFAAALAPHLHGAVVTSATLRDGRDGDAAWGMARLRAGAVWLAPNSTRTVAVDSPFAYAEQARALVVTDVDIADAAQVAAAYTALFQAAGGGALGLFTSIARLRAAHGRAAPALEAAGIPLYAQHVDAMDIGTLLDLFRAQEDACLLGTDAVRDGVDVPGRALRLLVMDRVPWPRPTILHAARRAAFGGRAWDDAITRLRLTQAFGRLIRRAGDRGAFVLLDPRLPSRLADAFPHGVAVQRVGLAEAVAGVRAWVGG
jgi:ATP-dependent DNA helicase DinG